MNKVKQTKIIAEGEAAYRAAEPATANPYPWDSDEYLIWNAAYSSATDQD